MDKINNNDILNNEKNATSKHTKHKNGKHKKHKKTNKFLIILRVFFIIVFVFSAFYLIKWNSDNKANAKLNNSLIQYVSVNPDNSQNFLIDFDGLKKENNYFFAWLIVKGTEINYPVVHYIDNDYYLTHSFDNSSNKAGCPFADYKAKCDGSDKNLVIYAHNRRDRKYVCNLKKCFKGKLVLK